jgi:hypothetical protein
MKLKEIPIPGTTTKNITSLRLATYHAIKANLQLFELDKKSNRPPQNKLKSKSQSPETVLKLRKRSTRKTTSVKELRDYARSLH